MRAARDMGEKICTLLDLRSEAEDIVDENDSLVSRVWSGFVGLEAADGGEFSFVCVGPAKDWWDCAACLYSE